jgi:hypothetical protein
MTVFCMVSVPEERTWWDRGWIELQVEYAAWEREAQFGGSDLLGGLVLRKV